MEYHKWEIDNTICKRRFHLAYESGSVPLSSVQIPCPHCGEIIFEAQNHPEVLFLRDENLIKSPDGTGPIHTRCQFKT